MKFRLALFALLLSGCASGFSDWAPEDKLLGPLIAGDSRTAKVFYRCRERPLMEQAMASSGSNLCEVGYRLSTGALVPGMSVSGAIDAYLRALPEYKTWPKSTRLDEPFPDLPAPPYWISVLSLEPTIVLLVPRQSQRDTRYQCGGHPLQGSRCLWAAHARDWVPYYPVLKTVPGLRWFSPGLTTGLVELPMVGDRYAFPLPGVTAELINDGGQLKFLRKQ